MSIPPSPLTAEHFNGPLTTARLVCEPLTEHHAPLLFDAMRSPEVYEWISSAPPASVGDLARGWAALAEGRRRPGERLCLDWAVRRLSDGAWIGRLDVEIRGVAPAPPSAGGAPHPIASNVGYTFYPRYWRQGYASEAVSALAAHLAHMGVTEQHATVTLGNLASERVLERAGFRRTGILVGNDRIRGVLVDDVGFVRRDPVHADALTAPA